MTKATNGQNIFWRGQVSDDILLQVQGYLVASSKVTERHVFGDPGDTLKPQFEAFMDKHATTPFNAYLLELIKKKGMDNPQAYTASGVSRSTFSKIKNDMDYHTSKETVASFAIGLKLTVPEAEELYLAAGYRLTTSEMPDLIIRFFIENKMYRLDDINYCLDFYQFPLIGTAAFESEE